MTRARPATALCAVAALALACAIATPARAQPSPAERTVMDAVDRLKPGEFLWAPEIAPEGPVLLIVNVTTQRAVLYRNGVPIAVSTVSTGREGHRTPTGVFTILQKQVEHYSSIYDNAPMPYMQRLTWQGVALHGGHLPGYPASHGCVRLPHEFARLLYGDTRLGMTVIVTDQSSVPRLAPAEDPLGSVEPGPDGGTEPEWYPERAPSGPVSIVVSAADRYVVVLRNGRKIGGAPISIASPVEGTSAYILRAIDEAGYHWFTVALPGQAASDLPVEGLGKRFATNASFREAVATVVGPGTTVIVTADSLRNDTIRSERVIEAEPEPEPELKPEPR